jgi:hypothetical protein
MKHEWKPNEIEETVLGVLLEIIDKKQDSTMEGDDTGYKIEACKLLLRLASDHRRHNDI